LLADLLVKHHFITVMIQTFRKCVVPSFQWSSSPTRTARPTQCHIPEDLPNFTYFLLESSTSCFIYRPSKWNL